MKIKRRRFILYFSSLVSILIITQVAFFYFQNIQSQKSIVAIQTILRQEITSSNTFLIARTLSDLEKSEFLKCVQLTETQTGQEHLDLTFKNDCEHNPWMLLGKKVSIDLKSLNGTQWRLDFETINGDFFFLSLWLSRLLLSLMAIIGLAAYFCREDELIEEKNNEFNKKEKLRELASQAAHDVASPLVLFHALMDSDLVEPEAKEFLERGIERVKGIVGSLREQSELIEEGETSILSQVDLVSVVSDVVNEKRASSQEILWSHPGVSVLVVANIDELQRILSNLINNAIEASLKLDSHIEILVKDDVTPVIEIKDKGKGIPADILPKLGKRGASFGKNGSGLGLYHAKSCMDKWDGSLKIRSQEGCGTIVELHFKADF